MYKSKNHIEKKLAQAKYTIKEMQKFKGKVFVNNGVDQETGAYPLQVKISSFLACTRSVLQYAYKEAKEKGLVTAYETAVNKRPIIRAFKDLRDTDIHEMVIGTHTVISCSSQIKKTETPKIEETGSKAKEANIIHHFSRPLTVTNELIENLRKEGQINLADAAEARESLYEPVNFDGETDLFVLCEKYISNLDAFLTELVKNEIVT